MAVATDFTQRFLFDETDVRGELTLLEQSYAHVLAKHPYPRPVAQLLGELMAAASLLVGTLKFEGLLVLQVRSSGAVPMLMVECSSQREIRGIARYEAEQLSEESGFAELVGGGVLAITIDPLKGQRYQGLVSLDEHSLSAALTQYFAQSEQLVSRFWLCADGRRARGMLLQQLPAARQLDAQERQGSWEHLVTLADTLSMEELSSLDNPTLLHRLYHQEPVRLFEPQVLEFRCSCSRERSATALTSLGQADAEQLLQEQGGRIEIDCQFCNQNYVFDAADVAQLFSGAGSQAPSDTRH